MLILKIAIILIVTMIVLSPVLMRWSKVRTFIDEVSFEMTKVTWPSQEEVRDCTVLVFVSTIILTLMVGVVDKVFSMIVQLMF